MASIAVYEAEITQKRLNKSSEPGLDRLLGREDLGSNLQITFKEI